ncbi:hypothetical protein ZPR_1353 [Zunongwangia profunda SM-A87]|uniref:Uncharacterized protein n=1 Tax=Zunongwangia profunda (strain DSM 18752 / CCTCC AB 206139 / SM-A87) TaxID=655815 RepID=D5BJM3_ZUNPS|nr:hypothetical protein ZPR_1353 [Zunongwangia profunda SM-A87]
MNPGIDNYWDYRFVSNQNRIIKISNSYRDRDAWN